MNLLRPRFGLPFLKLTLGALFLILFFSTYQPTFSMPPVRQSKAYALEIIPKITPASLPVEFSLPHPGYISTKFSLWHPGIDLATGLAMPIHPIASGTVTDAGYNFWGLGLIVAVDHGFGYSSLYAHIGRLYVKKGDRVEKTSLLGEVGMTGKTSGPHTHLEVYKDGKNIDPMQILPKINDFPTNPQ